MSQIEVEAAEVVAFLRRASAEIAKEVTVAVKAAAEKGAEAARRNAAQQGFEAPGRSGRGKGDLIRKIGTASRGTTAFIRETANRDGFQYPRVYEFGRSGERAFLRPAATEIEPEALAEIEAAVVVAIDRLSS